MSAYRWFVRPAMACALLCVSPAFAADLGGDCCADLEERIAELEATAVRHGNRKVSLAISGWVSQRITTFDDGIERNTYVHDIGSTLATHVKFSGSAKFAPGWSAGYVLHIEAINSDGLTTNQINATGPALEGSGPLHVSQSYWTIKSDTLGSLSIGKRSQASDNAAIAVDQSGSAVAANWVAFDIAGFALREVEGGDFAGLTWGQAGGCHGMGGAWGDCNGLPRNVARYDTPVLAGFSASASWGEDDMWDAAVRFAHTGHHVKVVLAAAYAHTTDPALGASGVFVDVEALSYTQAAAYIEHLGTGLFTYGAYGRLSVDATIPDQRNLAVPDAETYYAKAGWRARILPLGTSIFYGEYLRNDDGYAATSNSLVGSFETAGGVVPVTYETRLEMWGVGIVQEIDKAAMSVWLKYRHMTFDEYNQVGDGPGDNGFPTRPMQYVGFGGLISF